MKASFHSIQLKQ